MCSTLLKTNFNFLVSFLFSCTNAFELDQSKILLLSKELSFIYFVVWEKVASILFYYIPSSEILEFPSEINFDIISSNDINFHFHFLP